MIRASCLSARPHGESAVVLQLLTRAHGRHAGLVRGGQGRRARGMLQPGNRVAATWRARLADHLGSYRLRAGSEPRGARLMDDPDRLAALSAAAAVSERALPEREPHPGLLRGSCWSLLQALEGDHWAEDLCRLGDWRCWPSSASVWIWDPALPAAPTTSLAYVSPRTGRAVSLAAGEPYRDRLLDPARVSCRPGRRRARRSRTGPTA